MSKNVHKNTRKNAPDKVHDVDAAPVEAREETPADTAGAGELKGDETLEAGKASIQESGASGPDEDAALTTRDLVEKLTRERDDFLERLKRERASFLNHKKRVEKERREWESASICRFVQELLPFIDDMDRAMKATDEASDVDTLRKGFEMICNRFQEALKAGGVEEIPSDGESFDPKVHEAILQVEDLDQPAGTILETTHRGFQISGRLIRPAKVVVSQVPQSSPPRDEKNEDAVNDLGGQDNRDIQKKMNKRKEETEEN